MLCNAAAREAEREKLFTARNEIFIFRSYHPSLASLSLPLLAVLLIAISRTSGTECMLFSCYVRCSVSM